MKNSRLKKPAITFRLLLGILALAVVCLLLARLVSRFTALAVILRILAVVLIGFSLYKSDKAIQNLQEERNASQEIAQREQP